MTADRDALTQQLAEALRGRWVIRGDADACLLAAALLPVVLAYGEQRAAEELRDAAHYLDDGNEQTAEVALGGAAYVHRVLCDRAAALTTTEETQR